MFASLGAAYDSLSDGLKDVLCNLKAWHSSRHVFGKTANRDVSHSGRLGNADAATQDACHPVVIAHPVSGRPTLYINPQFTLRFDGWTEEESKALMEMLWKHVTRDGHRRLMHRITVDGVALQPSRTQLD